MVFVLKKMTLFGFAVDSIIIGYYEYKSIWESPTADNNLLCECEVGNVHDTHAIAIRKDNAGETKTVGYIP